MLHSGLQETREQAALLPLPQLRSSHDRRGSDLMDLEGQTVDEKDSNRNPPARTTLFTDVMSDAPRDRLGSPAFPYSFATMQPLSDRPPQRAGESPDEMRSPHPTSGGAQDLIAAGQISVADAQRLLNVYTNVLEKHVIGLGCRWPTLDALQSRSPILTASVMAVAALHDPQSEHIYPICNQELRRLVAASLFDQRVDRDYLRALCLASVWLSDASWTLSGVAIRRAIEVDLAGSYQRVIQEGSEDAAHSLRLWYHLYLCDRNLSFVFSRDSLVHDDASVVGWDKFTKSPVATSQDQALVMPIGLHLIMGTIRGLFGSDNGAPIPVAYSTQIAYFRQQIDHWLGLWLSVLRGEFRNLAAWTRRLPSPLC